MVTAISAWPSMTSLGDKPRAGNDVVRVPQIVRHQEFTAQGSNDVVGLEPGAVESRVNHSTAHSLLSLEVHSMRKTNVALVIGTVIAVTLIASVLPSAADSGGGSSAGTEDVLRFDTMFAVVAPFTGATNPVHGVPGAGAPWVIDDADGRLESNGDIDVRVEGLVLVSTGQNPAAQFQAIVACDTVVNGAVTTVDVTTGPFPADVAGNSRIRDTIALPDPCLSPTVFVGPVGGAPRWFAVTGR